MNWGVRMENHGMSKLPLKKKKDSCAEMERKKKRNEGKKQAATEEALDRPFKKVLPLPR